jgi:hypothetical protein
VENSVEILFDVLMRGCYCENEKIQFKGKGVENSGETEGSGSEFCLVQRLRDLRGFLPEKRA